MSGTDVLRGRGTRNPRVASLTRRSVQLTWGFSERVATPSLAISKRTIGVGPYARRADLDGWAAFFEAPDAAELALFDQPPTSNLTHYPNSR